MVDRGPVLTSAVIFYLSIGAAIFQALEEPNLKRATESYRLSKEDILRRHKCLSKEALDEIVEVVSAAQGQGVTLSGNYSIKTWDWPNAVIFTATVITTIGYGNVAPKTSAGRLFCVFFGLFGVPLCLTWISALGKFFAGRARRLGQFMRKRGVGLRKAQFICTAIFIIWGVMVHLVLPPFIFMATEGWDYIEGLYFSFITISTIGFGDYVAGVNPRIRYSVLYRYFVEMWIYMGLAWLSLFINWKVSMFVEVHKAIKKRRKKRKESFENDHEPKGAKALAVASSKDVKIFSFLSKSQETYNDHMKQIGRKSAKAICEQITAEGKLANGQTPTKSSSQKHLTDFQVKYTKDHGTSFDEIAFFNGNRKESGVRPLSNKDTTMFVNQLDRISEEEGELWDARENRPLIFENANITFVNELGEDDLSADEKSKSSNEENAVEVETAQKEDKESFTDESYVSSSEETSVSYEQLRNDYKVDNVTVTT
ncbi:potassium channel subfamily K member 5 [Lissotriton helveticus]